MTAQSVLAHLFQARPNPGQSKAALLDARQPICLSPAVTADDLPAGFEDVLGYRERIESLGGGDRQHVLDPVWTLIPKV